MTGGRMDKKKTVSERAFPLTHGDGQMPICWAVIRR